MISNWSPNPPKWSSADLQLLPNLSTTPPNTNLKTILEKSAQFPIKFPVETIRCKTLQAQIEEETLENYINSTYPILHENILHLFAKYLQHKKHYGNNIEKEVYQNMDLIQFIDRLLSKRAVSFLSRFDYYQLYDGQEGHSNWWTIGTASEKAPFIMQDYLSYDEIKLSAFLSVSSFTHFLNVGDRRNKAIPEVNRELVQDNGVIVGLIGPRLVDLHIPEKIEEKSWMNQFLALFGLGKKINCKVMDCQEILISSDQNTETNGYGKVFPLTIHHLFADLYEEECLVYDDVIKNKSQNIEKYTDLQNGVIFDNYAYYKRLLFSLDTFFFEANTRAKQNGTFAYIHLVGIGLGTWKRCSVQDKIFMDTCAQRIQILGSRLDNVSDICFAYMNYQSCGDYKDGDTIPIEGHPLKGIKILIRKREPHEKLTQGDKDKLLVVSYAWDGNALPGNEFWLNELTTSGDPAAACSTQISELHNAHINPKVTGANLRIVQCDGQVKSLQEYFTNAEKSDL